MITGILFGESQEAYKGPTKFPFPGNDTPVKIESEDDLPPGSKHVLNFR